MRPARNNQTDILIIGGGASGLAAACICADRGADTLIMEKQARVGRKILSTGNGRCNLMPAGEPVFFGDAAFAHAVLSRVTSEQVRTFFASLGLTMREDEGRVYPASGQAAAVLDVLRLKIDNAPHVCVVDNAPVVALDPVADGWCARTKEGEAYHARRVILAGGGSAAPKLGGGEDMYTLAQSLGHTLIPTRPALSQLETDIAPIRGLSGLRVPAILTLLSGETPVDAASGELLFTDYGVSGVCVMQLSRAAGDLLAAGRDASLSIDFSPLLGLAPIRYERVAPGKPGQNVPACEALLRDRAERLPPGNLLTGMLPRLLAERLGNLPIPALARALTDYRLPVRAVRGFAHAQVTAGGVATHEIDPDTMMSRLHGGLYMAGELLDVDGDCGGHNLLFAWASGMLASQSACGSSRQPPPGAQSPKKVT